jgi:hypothetical protein
MYKLAEFRNKLGARGRAEASARIVIIDIQLRDLNSAICTVPPQSELGLQYLEKIKTLKAERAELQKKLPFMILR